MEEMSFLREASYERSLNDPEQYSMYTHLDEIQTTTGDIVNDEYEHDPDPNTTEESIPQIPIKFTADIEELLTTPNLIPIESPRHRTIDSR